ncbi:MAG: type II secretion system major pseudopilin GspG [Lysobacterales bacterium]
MNVKSNRGFTLIEILVVVVIIGILSTVVVLNVGGVTEDSRKTAAESDIATLEQALEIYKLQNAFYPSTQQGLQALVSRPGGQPEPRSYAAGGYIKRLPKDPWGNDYLYANPGSRSAVDVYSLGADGQPGGEGAGADIGNWGS